MVAPGEAPAVVFDVGAHHGQTALRYLQLFPAATVYCFEPFAESFAVMQERLAGQERARPFNLALSDREGEAEFRSNASSATNSLLAAAAGAEKIWPGVAPRGTARVRTTTLDAFCREHSVGAVDLLKLDVQGAEPLVLKGGEGLLRAGRVGMVFTEILTMPSYAGQAELHEFLAMMKGYGFELFNFYSPNLTPNEGKLRQADAIFLPSGAGP